MNHLFYHFAFQHAKKNAYMQVFYSQINQMKRSIASCVSSASSLSSASSASRASSTLFRGLGGCFAGGGLRAPRTRDAPSRLADSRYEPRACAL